MIYMYSKLNSTLSYHFENSCISPKFQVKDGDVESNEGEAV